MKYHFEDKKMNLELTFPQLVYIQTLLDEHLQTVSHGMLCFVKDIKAEIDNAVVFYDGMPLNTIEHPCLEPLIDEDRDINPEALEIVKEEDLPMFMRMPPIPTEEQQNIYGQWRDLVFDPRAPLMREPILTSLSEFTPKGLKELKRLIEWEENRRGIHD